MCDRYRCFPTVQTPPCLLKCNYLIIRRGASSGKLKLFIIDAKDNVIAKVGVNDNKDFDFDSMYKLAVHQIKLRTKEYAR